MLQGSMSLRNRLAIGWRHVYGVQKSRPITKQTEWSEFGTFRHDGSLLLDVCTKFSSNICCCPGVDTLLFPTFDWWRHSTSGFSWSRGRLYMAVMHLLTKFGANIFIQSANINMFRNSTWRPPPSWILMINVFYLHHDGSLVL